MSCSRFQAIFTTPRGSPERRTSPPSLLPEAPACRLWICLLRAFRRGGAIVCGLCLASCTLQNVFRVAPRCDAWLAHSSLWLGDVRHVMDHISFTHTSIGGRLGCFHLLAVCETRAADIWMRVTNRTPASCSLGSVPQSGIAGQMVILCFA